MRLRLKIHCSFPTGVLSIERFSWSMNLCFRNTMTSTLKNRRESYGVFFYLLLILLLFSEPREYSHLSVFFDEVTKHLIFQAGELNCEVLATWEYIEKLGKIQFSLTQFLVLQIHECNRNIFANVVP